MKELLDKVDNPHLSMLLYSAMSLVFSKCHDWEEELKYANLAYEKCIEPSDSTRVHRLRLCVAQSYHNVKNYAAADSLYAEILNDPIVPDSMKGKAVLDANMNGKDKSAAFKYQEVHDKATSMIENILNDEKGQKKFEREMDMKMDGVMTKFRADFPDLKKDDYRVACFLFAQFNADMISMLCPHISVSATYTRKHRMKHMQL